MPCFQACSAAKPFVPRPVEWARPRADPRSWHRWAQTPRGAPVSGLGQPVRRTGDPTAARNVRSSARGYRGDSEADGPRPLYRRTRVLLAVLVEPPPIFPSDSRAMPTLTPPEHFPCRHPGGTQMAPGGPPGWWGGARPRVSTSPSPPWRGTATTTEKRCVAATQTHPPTPSPPRSHDPPHWLGGGTAAPGRQHARCRQPPERAELIRPH